MADHTPGPWHRNIPPTTKYPVVFSGRNTHVAALRDDVRVSPEEAEANINLIAAAPELLAALKLFTKRPENEDYGVWLQSVRALEIAAAAIAKAEGERR